MALLTPNQIAKSGSEHSHQAAFFAWLNCAALRGFEAANLWAATGEWPKVELDELFPSGFKGLPDLRWVFAIPNGGSRGDTELTRKIEGGKMKAEGVKAGVADVFFPKPIYKQCESDPQLMIVDYCGLFIEMKKPDEKPVREGSKGGLSDKQIEFSEFVKRNNYAWCVCYSWREAADALQLYVEMSL